jgi:hypothetical protein
MPTSKTELHTYMAHRILQHHHAHPEHTGKPSRATRHTVQFSRVEVERIALADASGLRIPEEQIKRDITHWRKVGTLSKTIMLDTPNRKRVTTFLANDPRFNIVRQIITEGGHLDTPPDFVRARRTAPFRHRLLPV